MYNGIASTLVFIYQRFSRQHDIIIFHINLTELGRVNQKHITIIAYSFVTIITKPLGNNSCIEKKRWQLSRSPEFGAEGGHLDAGRDSSNLQSVRAGFSQNV
jgi:hypothetical protein